MDDVHSMASTAPAPAAQPIPLICSICPKTSKFSDVSHLLTHIASKGHLSNMFKLDIAKVTDSDAQRRLDEYQAWFDRYNIRGLLQNRSENRIQKNSGGRGRSASRGGSQSLSLRGGGNSSMVSRNRTGRNNVTREKRRLVDDNSPTATYATATTKYNPQDSLHHVSNFPAFPNVNAQHPWQPGHSAQQWPPLPNWNGAYFGHGFQQDLDFDIDVPIRDEDEEDNTTINNNAVEVSSVYEPSDVDDEDDDSRNCLRSEDTVDTTVFEEDVPLVPEAVDDEESEQKHFRKYLKGDISKLEGVGGFDAAPEDQRKRRNQKKDPSVLVHMEASSRAVRTVEQVTDLNFNHVRWRDVYDEPSIAGSEDEDDDVKPPKKAKHNTPVKARRNVGKATRGVKVKLEENTSRESSVASATRVTRGMTRQRGRARQQRQLPQASTPRTASAEPVEPSEGSTLGSLVARDSTSSSNGTSLSSYAGAHDEETHCTGVERIKPDDQQGINVYRDSTPGGISELRPIGAPTNFLAHRRQHDGLPRLALRPTNANANVPLLSPTPLFKGHGPARLFSGKENNHGGFSGGSPAAFNPYLNSTESLGEGSYNPLCVPNQDNSAIRGYSWGDNVKPLATGFQPINSSSGLNSLNAGSQDSEVYRCTPHDGAGEYGI